MITLAIHAAFLIVTFTLRRSLRLTLYLALSAPALALEFWLESISRPKYDQNGTLKRAGEDLDAPGLTEFFWDIIYWTWINLIFVIVIGNNGWWVYWVVPAYAVYAAVTTASGLKGMMGGMGGAGGEGEPQAQSNRQKKMEKRGGQKVAYR